jgi:hypothetical protein
LFQCVGANVVPQKLVNRAGVTISLALNLFFGSYLSTSDSKCYDNLLSMPCILGIQEGNLETQLASVIVLLTWYWVVGGVVELGVLDWKLLFMEDILPGFLLAAQRAAQRGASLLKVGTISIEYHWYAPFLRALFAATSAYFPLDVMLVLIYSE